MGRFEGQTETAMANPLDDWTKHGPAVLAKVRKEDPSTYLRVAFDTIPKEQALVGLLVLGF
jgi:hypothetical protein